MDGVIKGIQVQRSFFLNFRCLSIFAAAVPAEVIDEFPDITVIILILLAVIILALLIVFFIIFSQRRRRNKAKGTLCYSVRRILFLILKSL